MHPTTPRAATIGAKASLLFRRADSPAVTGRRDVPTGVVADIVRVAPRAGAQESVVRAGARADARGSAVGADVQDPAVGVGEHVRLTNFGRMSVAAGQIGANDHR